MILKRLIVSVLFLSSITLSAQIEESKLDKLIQETLSTFEVPGISVGIYKDGKEVYAKGYAESEQNNSYRM